MNHHQCPHCNGTLSVTDGVKILHGDGLRRYVKVRSKRDASIETIVEVGNVNPNSMDIVSEPSLRR
jgi:hypothetical protein